MHSTFHEEPTNAHAMNLNEYNQKVLARNFEEYPIASIGYKPLNEFINLDAADLDLKTYLAKLILNRNFPPPHGIIFFPADIDWFLAHFRSSFRNDLIKPWLTNTVGKTFDMIMNGDVFTDGIIATSFMFSVIEFYTKYELGFRPDQNNHNDYLRQYYPDHKSIPRMVSITTAFRLLQTKATDLVIAQWLNEVDGQAAKVLQTFGYNPEIEKGWKISDKVSTARNIMLHGETHSFHNTGKYLLVLYALFHYHRLLLDSTEA